MYNRKIKIFTILMASISLFAVSCMQNSTRPKRSNGEDIPPKFEDVEISLNGQSTNISINVNNYWENNEVLESIFSNQLKNSAVADTFSIKTTGTVFRYKFADNMDLVDPNDSSIVYKKYTATVLVKVFDKDNTGTYGLHGKYVAGGVYEVVKERGKTGSGDTYRIYDEAEDTNQPKVGEYEVIIYNTERHTPTDLGNLHFLFRYAIPSSDANSNYDPEKIFDQTYHMLGKDKRAFWVVVPQSKIK